MLVDSHCHLDFPDFAGEVETVVARAEAAGVGTMLTIGTKLSHRAQVLAVAERFASVFCTVGIHPHEAAAEDLPDVDGLAALAEHPKVVGFGETGLDYHYEHSPRDVQQRSFRRHIKAARRTGLPVVIHTRSADDDAARILAEETARGAFAGVLHCFSSTPELARRAIDLGFYISFSGILTFPKSGELRRLAAELPAERLLVETDAPFLAPVPRRGKRNEPALVQHTAACLASARGAEVDEIAAITTANFFRLFGKARS
jgi:TatD DNase family protein